MADTLTFGPWLKQRRQQLAVTQAVVAERAGCALSTLRKIENGDLLPSTALAHALAAAFQIPDPEVAAFVTFARSPAMTVPPTAFAAPRPLTPAIPTPVTPAAVLPAPSPAAPPHSSSAPRGQRLPIPVTPLIGRQAEITQGCALLRDPAVRLVTLSGPPGTGKSRLGLAIAEALQGAFRDGVYFVPLAALTDPTLVADTLISRLGITSQNKLSALLLLQEFLRAKELLLLLDNFEQLVAAVPLLVELLQHAPGVKLLVTSRILLKTYGEYEFFVQPLAVPAPDRLPPVAELAHYPALELFVQRAQAVQPTFALTSANAATVVQICALLDGLPLAIEMAAARCKLYPLPLLQQQLQQRLLILTSQVRNLPPRQQTLHAAIDWSYQLLQPTEQRLFRLLGLFVGGCTAADMAALWTAPAEIAPAQAVRLVEGLLQALVEQSVVHFAFMEEGEGRYTMLATLRDYALAQLQQQGESAEAWQRFTAYYLALAQRADAGLTGHQAPVWLRRLAADHDNYRALLHRFVMGDGVGSEDALQLAEALSRFWFRTGQWREGRRWLETTLQHGTTATPLTRARLLRNLARLLMNQGESAPSIAYATECLALFRSAGDQAGMADVLFILGYNANQQQALSQSQQYLEESRALWSALGDKRALRNVLALLGAVMSNQGDLTQATAYYTTALAIAEESHDHSGLANAYSGLGELGRLRGDQVAAVRYFELCLAHLQQSGGRALLAPTVHNLAQACFAVGNYTRAATLLGESLALALAQDNLRVILATLFGCARLAYQQQQVVSAVQLCGAVAQGLASAHLYFDRSDQNDFTVLLTALRADLAATPFAAAWAAGEKLTQAEAIALAQTIIDGG